MYFKLYSLGSGPSFISTASFKMSISAINTFPFYTTALSVFLSRAQPLLLTLRDAHALVCLEGQVHKLSAWFLAPSYFVLSVLVRLLGALTIHG